MPIPISSNEDIAIGEYYEACNFHPCLCTSQGGDYSGNAIEGISLVDGSILNCNVKHCGLRKLSIDEVIEWKMNGPKDANQEIEPWWT